MTVGQAIALVHHPPRITIHSIQDGREEHSPPFVDQLSESTRLTGVWWFKDERQAETDAIPDIFKRGLDIVCLRLDGLDGWLTDTYFCESQGLLIPSSSNYLFWTQFWTNRGC
jgi:hypothetical protein